MKNLKNKAYFIPVIVLAFIILMSVFFLSPRLLEIGSINRKLSTDKKTLAKLTQKVANLEGIDTVELSSKVDETFKVLPTEKEVPNVLITLKALTEEVGISLKGIELNPGEISTASAISKNIQKAGLPSLTLGITVSGDKDKIKAFLDKLNTVAPLMRIEKLSFSQSKEFTTTSGLVLNTFFLSLPESMGPVEVPLPVITKQEEETFRKLTEYHPVKASETILSPVQSGKENPFSL